MDRTRMRAVRAPPVASEAVVRIVAELVCALVFLGLIPFARPNR